MGPVVCVPVLPFRLQHDDGFGEWVTDRRSSPVAMLLRHSAHKASDLITFGHVDLVEN
jgi:hypothetical protein